MKSTMRFCCLITCCAVIAVSIRGEMSLAGMTVIQDDTTPDKLFPWKEDLELAVRESAVSGKPIFAKFEAVWCGPCRALSKEFEQPSFKTISEAAILLRVDIDQNPEIAKDYDINAIPTILLLDSNGEIVAEKTGGGDVAEFVEWLIEAVKETEFKMPDVLASNEPPTRTEIQDLIENLQSRDPTMRQLTMERLTAFPGKTRIPLIESLQQPGKLAQKLAVLEVLDRWRAPIDGLDPWVETTFPEERLAAINTWKETPLEELESILHTLTDADLAKAKEEIDLLLVTKNPRANLARLTRYGPKLLPTVYERLEQSQSDIETARLTALRYWLVSSNELRLGWPGGILELASSSLDNRRGAATALLDRASLLDEPLLLELFADPDPLVRELSLKGLQRIGAKQTDATLARLLNDPDKNVRAAVLKQFAEAEASHMASEVAKYLESETDSDLIVQALRFMKSASGDKSVTAVLNFANHESWQVRAEVAEALGKIESSGISPSVMVKKGEAVMKLLEDDDGFVVSRAVKSLPSEKDKKMLETLTDIALRKPNIAGEIVDSMTDDYYGYSRNGERDSLAPFLLRFFDHENAAVRAAGIKGYAKQFVEKITDEELTELLKDDAVNVRIEALSALLARFERIRQQASRADHDHMANYDQIYEESYRPSITQSLFKGAIESIFGSRSDKVPLEQSDIQIEMDSTTDSDQESEFSADSDDSSENAELETNDVAGKSNELKDSVSEPPKLLQEEFIGLWLQDESLRPELSQAIAELPKLVQSTNDKERALALACRVILGDHSESLDELMELSATNDEFQFLHTTLAWMPFKLRTRIFKSMLEKADSQDEFGSIVYAYSRVQNPEAAQKIWEISDNSFAAIKVLHSSLLAAYFGSSVSTYSIDLSQSVSKSHLNFAKDKIVQNNDNQNPQKQQLTLLLLRQLDLEYAKKIAQPLAESSEYNEVKDLAFRILLIPESSSTDEYVSRPTPAEVERARSEAVRFLETDEAWKFKTTLRYLAYGERALEESVDPDITTHLQTMNYYYSSSSYGGDDSAKVRVPSAPKGLTLELLEQPNIELDSESQALVCYFRALLDENVDLTPLLDYYHGKRGNEEIAKLVYQAIAMQDDDSLIPIVAEIYENIGNKDMPSFAADLYWTIRIMDGKQAIGLRKQIRDEVGMDKLKRY